jgi:hypothetical protein
MTIQIPPMPEAFLDRVRNRGVDDLGQAVVRRVAQGGEPCRDALRRARPGEELILASFSPFTASGPYHEYGPVFVLAQPATPATEEAARDRLPLEPLSHGWPEGYLRDRFVLRAYSAAEEILDAAMVTPAEADETVKGFLRRPEVAFVHARFPLFGCFACRIDRYSSSPSAGDEPEA